MIIDCFPFFNEFDLLEIRLHELSEVVDIFVLSEATLTFTNKPKPLYYNENKDRFKEFKDRIYHVIIDSYNKIDKINSWSMDYGQKQMGVDAMTKRFNPSPDDMVLLSDCDEIPKAEKIKSSEWTTAMPEMSLFYYWMNCRCINKTWRFAKWIRPEQKIQLKKLRGKKGGIRIKNAGWHFSYLGDIKQKLAAFAHTEYDKPPYNTDKHITATKKAGKDLFNRRYKYEFIKDLNYLPQYVLNNIDRFKRHIHV